MSCMTLLATQSLSERVESAAYVGGNATKCAIKGKDHIAFLLLFGTTKRNVMVCALSYLWDEATKTKILLRYLIKNIRNIAP